MRKARETFQWILRFWSGVRHPRTFFQTNQPDTRTIVQAMLGFFLLLILLVALSSLYRNWMDPERVATTAVARQLKMLFPTDPRFPVDVIQFTLVWSGFILLASLLRRVFAGWLGDGEGKYATYLLITYVSILPLLTGAAVIRMVSNVFPFSAMEGRADQIYLRVLVTALIYLIGWIADGVICVTGLKTRAAQNRGRAILTWIMPYVAFMVFLSLMSA